MKQNGERKRRAQARLVAIAMLLVVGFTGCGTLDAVMSDALGTALSRPAERMLADIAGLTDALAFQLTFTQVFFLGGYGAGYDDFAEGEGTTWQIRSREGRDSSVVNAERALLRRNADGTSWWYLRYESDESELEYEARIDAEFRVMEVYFRDPDTGEVRHRVFDHPEIESDDDEEAWDGEYDDDFVATEDDFRDYRRERVRITVGAGTFDADHIVYDYRDEESSEEFEYHWWVSDQVPGELLKYEWISATEGTTLSGELMQIRRDYRTRFGAY